MLSPIRPYKKRKKNWYRQNALVAVGEMAARVSHEIRIAWQLLAVSRAAF
jgi:hypothetical protein